MIFSFCVVGFFFSFLFFFLREVVCFFVSLFLNFVVCWGVCFFFLVPKRNLKHCIAFVLFTRYNIERPHETVYDIDLDITVCWKESCTDPIVILQDTMFSASQCGREGSSSRRKRRSVDDLYVLK